MGPVRDDTIRETAWDVKGHNVTQSVDRTEAGVDRAGKRLESAQTEIKEAEKHIQRADETAGNLTERTRRNAEELDDCQHLADRMSECSERIQRIIADVESANKQIKQMEHKQTVIRRQRDVWAAIAALSLGGVIARR